MMVHIFFNALLLLVSSHVIAQIPETNDKELRDILYQQLHNKQYYSWRHVQEEMKDTVVQIFAYIAHVDLLQPYKTPSQRLALGSGFFITEQGDIITNFHVIDQAIAVFIQIPSLGKQPIRVNVIGVCSDRDIALLRVTPEGAVAIKNAIGCIPYAVLGDSTTVQRSDEVLALGYPLGQESLKSTTGIISGREKYFVQISAPINPGSSGGPLLNREGKVVGINSSGIVNAQNVGYIIPIDELTLILKELYQQQLLYKPSVGISVKNATTELVEYLGNPLPGGCIVTEVAQNSPAWQGGIQPGDMLYAINGYAVDIFGMMNIPSCEDKISYETYESSLKMGENVYLDMYRLGNPLRISVKLAPTPATGVKKVYPLYDSLDYEIFGGMVFMELTHNHLKNDFAQLSSLATYVELRKEKTPIVIITHIFSGSEVLITRTLHIGCIIKEINGIAIQSLDDVRSALSLGVSTGYVTLRAQDPLSFMTGDIFTALSFKKALEETLSMAPIFNYKVSTTIKKLHAELQDALP